MRTLIIILLDGEQTALPNTVCCLELTVCKKMLKNNVKVVERNSGF